MDCETCMQNQKNNKGLKGCCNEYDIKKMQSLPRDGKFICDLYEDIDREKVRIESRGW